MIHLSRRGVHVSFRIMSQTVTHDYWNARDIADSLESFAFGERWQGWNDEGRSRLRVTDADVLLFEVRNAMAAMSKREAAELARRIRTLCASARRFHGEHARSVA